MKQEENITKRELEVLKLISYEYTSTEIAHKLFISNHTALTHRKNLLSKLNVKNTAGLVRKAFEKRLLQLSSLILLILSFSSFIGHGQNSPHLEVVGDTKLRGSIDIHHAEDSTSIFIGFKSGINMSFVEISGDGGEGGGEMDEGEENFLPWKNNSKILADTSLVNRWNTFLGSYSGNKNVTGQNNTFIGSLSGQTSLTGDNNTFVGAESGFTNSSGRENSFFGTRAGYSNRTSSQNSYFGFEAGHSSTSFKNSFFGYHAGKESVSGSNNTFVGSESGLSNTNGAFNAFFGSESGKNNDEGRLNTFIGTSSGQSNTEGDDNTFVGHISGQDNISGSFNSFVGRGAGLSNSTGSHNSVLGQLAAKANKTGSYNTFLGSESDLDTSLVSEINKSIAIGYNSRVACSNCAVIGGTGPDSVNVGIGTSTPEKTLHVIGDVLIEGDLKVINDADSTSIYWGFLSGDSIDAGHLTNTFVGSLTGVSNTSGFANSFFGESAGMSNITGWSNSFFGHESGKSNTAGKWNSFYGNSSGQNNTTGSNNSFFGDSAGEKNESGINNTIIGGRSGRDNNDGNNNAFIGVDAGGGNTSGDSNTFLGYGSGEKNKTGNRNITIGYNADLKYDSLEYAIAIGSRANVDCNNCAVIGGIEEYTVNVGIGTSAPEKRIHVVGDGKIEGILDISESSDTTSLVIGREAGVNGDFTSVRNNTFTGFRAGKNNVLGESNTFYGSNAGVSNSNDDNNSFFGSSAGVSAQGGNNTYLGSSAGFQSINGEYNTFVGSGAGVINVRGDNNVFIGAGAGMTASLDSLDNAIAIGRNAKVECSDCAVIGTSSTNLGVGTQNPQATIHSKTTASDANQQLMLEETSVDGSVRMKFLNANVNSNSWSVGAKPLADGNAATAVMNFLYSEGGTASSVLKLFGDGDATLSGNLTEESDLRLKTNITTLSGVLPQLLRLNGYTYNWKNENKSKEKQIGLMAQEVKSLFPELISENSEGILSIKYTRFVPILIDGIKEQQKLINNQQAIIQQLLTNQEKILKHLAMD